MKRRLAAALATVTVLPASLASGAELVSQAKGFAAEFPAPARENAAPPPENAVDMTEWLSEVPGRAFLVTVTDWGPGDPYAEAVFD